MGFCYQKNFSNPTLPVDEAQFYALVRAGKWNEDIDGTKILISFARRVTPV